MVKSIRTVPLCERIVRLNEKKNGFRETETTLASYRSFVHVRNRIGQYNTVGVLRSFAKASKEMPSQQTLPFERAGCNEPYALVHEHAAQTKAVKLGEAKRALRKSRDSRK